MIQRSPRSAAALCIALFALAAAGVAHAQTWNETGDAGPLPATAQTTVGVGALTTLNGNLSAPDDVDMYCIQVTTSTTLTIQLQCVVILGPDVWVFDSTGKGVAAAQLCQGGGKTVTGALVLTPGLYDVAVSYDGVAPYNGANALWLPGYTLQRAPDGPGAALPVTSWVGTGTVQPLNPYTLTMFGVAYCDASTPASTRAWGELKVLYR